MPKTRSVLLPAALAALLVAVRSTYENPRLPDVRVGGFDSPEAVPDYDLLQTDRSGHDGVRGASLVVDTSERDLTFIARDIKARYADLVYVEFIDSESFLEYRGGALIFNTTAGAYYAGFVYGPPNNKGYLVSAAD